MMKTRIKAVCCKAAKAEIDRLAEADNTSRNSVLNYILSDRLEAVLGSHTNTGKPQGAEMPTGEKPTNITIDLWLSNAAMAAQAAAFLGTTVEIVVSMCLNNAEAERAA